MSPLIPERIFKLVCDWSLKQTSPKTKHMLPTAHSSTSIAVSSTNLLQWKLPIFLPVLKQRPAPHPFPSPPSPPCCVDI